MRMLSVPPLHQPVPALLNDVHSRLNSTTVAAVVRPANETELHHAVRDHARRGAPLIAMGARHAMGGQQFLRGGTVLDTSSLRGVTDFDPIRGQVVVRAGTRWPQLLGWLRTHPRNHRGWTVRQKQTGADDFSIGGSIAANIHGRGLTFAPLASDLEWIDVVRADGTVVRASSTEESGLFSLVVGGYGLFGVVASACLRLVPGCTLQREVRLTGSGRLVQDFDAAIASGCCYGDFQFAIDPGGDGFLRNGILSCYRPVDGDPDPDPLHLGDAGFRDLLLLAHTDKARAFERYADFYLATQGQRYPLEAQHSGLYLDGYHDTVDHHLGHAGSEMITELYVPRAALQGFLTDAAELLRAEHADVIYGTVRLVERDRDAFLPWAREAWACVVLNLHVRHDATGIARAQRAFRGLIDLALARGGSFYLTYHRWASADQVEAAHPRFREFLRAKHAHDPHGLFQSDWYRHYADLFGEGG